MCHVAVYTVVSLVISSPQREAPLGVFPMISQVSPKWSRIPPMSKSQAPPLPSPGLGTQPPGHLPSSIWNIFDLFTKLWSLSPTLASNPEVFWG